MSELENPVAYSGAIRVFIFRTELLTFNTLNGMSRRGFSVSREVTLRDKFLLAVA